MNELAGQGERGTASGGIVIGPGEGRTIPGTDTTTLIATGEQTGGSIGFRETASPPGSGPPRRVHYGCDELFYVLEGEFLAVRQPGTAWPPRAQTAAAPGAGWKHRRLWWRYGGLRW